jgi:hypothetical protein
VEDGQEFVADSDANAHYGNTALSGGESTLGVDHQQGPLRIGIFAGDQTDRFLSGAGYYGVMELSGNVSERTVTVGFAESLNFTGENGDGQLTTESGVAGNATQTNWPGMDLDPTVGVVHATGIGFRGGDWASPHGRLTISDRKDAAFFDGSANPGYGGRGARSL